MKIFFKLNYDKWKRSISVKNEIQLISDDSNVYHQFYQTLSNDASISSSTEFLRLGYYTYQRFTFELAYDSLMVDPTTLNFIFIFNCEF